MGMIMEREMSKDKVQTAIIWLMRDIQAVYPKLFSYIGYFKKILEMKDVFSEFGVEEIEGCKKLDDFDEQQLLDILQTEIKILAIASGSVPQWFLDGYEEESDWLADQEKERR